VSFATKPKIVRHMIARAIAAKVPFSFVAADSVYGTGENETLLRKAGKGYVLGLLPIMCSVLGASRNGFDSEFSNSGRICHASIGAPPTRPTQKAG
jgi:hypothetical protein